MVNRWHEITLLFEAALEIDTKEREQWLRKQCLDTELRNEVFQMLEAHEDDTTVLDQPANVYAAELLQSNLDDFSDVVAIGNYRLLEEIASGGMGKVYLAERSDGQYEHRVAVKILRSALSASHLERRFLTERQILASLDHPNVARILDGGVTESGAPYFAMEFVEGVPITTYSKDRDLSVDERLGLFLEVCSAVAHAHQRLVVHRDLKPSNIFVTPNGQVKLLDFGIAKVLESDLVPGGELHTITGLHMMTPEYASPEQVRGQPITIASDVYQLGLLLYELLAGQRPYELDSHSLTAIASAVLESEPQPPGTLAQLPSDLDAITMKALRKEPGARYPSVDHLAADIRRFIDGDPVEAHKGSFGYHAGKFVRRYRWAVSAACVFVAMLVVYALTITVQQARTARERDRAERYSDFVTQLFASPDPFDSDARLDQRDITVEEFLDQASRRMKTQLEDDPELRIDLLETVGEVYVNLGAEEKAQPLLREALSLSNQVYGDITVRSADIMGLLAWATEDVAEAESLYLHLLDITARVEPDGGPVTGRSLGAYADLLHASGRIEEADSILTLSIDPANWRDPDAEGHSGALLFKSRTQLALGNSQNADSLVRLAYDISVEKSGRDHQRTAIVLHHMAVVEESLGNMNEAEEMKRRVLAIWTASLGEDHPYTLSARNNLAITLGRTGNHAESEELMRDNLERRIRVYGEDSKEVAETRQNLGAMLMKQDRGDEAIDELTMAYNTFRIIQAGHYVTGYPLLSITELHLRNAHYARADTVSRAAMEHFARTLSSTHPLYAVALSRNGAALAGLGRREEARSQLTDAIDILESAGAFEPDLIAAEEWMADLDAL